MVRDDFRQVKEGAFNRNMIQRKERVMIIAEKTVMAVTSAVPRSMRAGGIPQRRERGNDSKIIQRPAIRTLQRISKRKSTRFNQGQETSVAVWFSLAGGVFWF